jgi:hypothetical protein
MAKEQTITEGLGLSESIFEILKDVCQQRLKENNTISDALECIAEDVREEAFGEATARVSDYEKKLILSGYITGLTKMRGQMEELKMMLMMMQFAKETKKVDGGFAGAIDMNDVPEEIREDLLKFLRRNGTEISGEEFDDE